MAAVCRGQAPLALAFERLEYQFSADPAQIYAPESSRAQGYVRQTVQDGTRLRSIVHLGAVVEHILRRSAKQKAGAGDGR